MSFQFLSQTIQLKSLLLQNPWCIREYYRLKYFEAGFALLNSSQILLKHKYIINTKFTVQHRCYLIQNRCCLMRLELFPYMRKVRLNSHHNCELFAFLNSFNLRLWNFRIILSHFNIFLELGDSHLIFAYILKLLNHFTLCRNLFDLFHRFFTFLHLLISIFLNNINRLDFLDELNIFIQNLDLFSRARVYQ